MTTDITMADLPSRPLGQPGKFGIAEYEQAIALLRACLHIDDAKRFANFADAKAAWAKIHHDETALRLCKALKLTACRRIGELAVSQKPPVPRKSGKESFAYNAKAPAYQLLRGEGLTGSEASAAIALQRMSPERFNAILQRPQVPGISSPLVRASRNPEWTLLRKSLLNAASNLRRAQIRELVRPLSGKEKQSALPLVRELTEQLDELERCLSAS